MVSHGLVTLPSFSQPAPMSSKEVPFSQLTKEEKRRLNMIYSM